MELIKELSGHSGCRLNLYKDRNRIFLRKDAGDVSYNKRLKKQYIKQKKFALKDVKTPEVFDCGVDDDGIFYFDMEYINGIAMSEYMNQIKIKEIVDLIGLLFKALPISQGKISPTAQKVFFDKIQSIASKIVLGSGSAEAAEAIELLQKFDFSKIPLSPCCGDLTLENIILSSKGIYVIDLLDSFYNSWMIDVAKLLQDIELGWSYRFQKRDFGLNLRLATAKQALIENLQSLENGQDALFSIYHILLLNVLRIYPYTKDKFTIDFLNNSVKTVISNIKEMEKDK